MTLRFHLIPIRIAETKNSGESTCWQGCAESRTLHYFFWDYTLVQPFLKSLLQFLRKLEIDLLKDPAITLLGIYPNNSPMYHRNTCNAMFTVASFVRANSWKEPKCPIIEKKRYRICGTFTEWSISQLLRSRAQGILKENGFKYKISSRVRNTVVVPPKKIHHMYSPNKMILAQKHR